MGKNFFSSYILRGYSFGDIFLLEFSKQGRIFTFEETILSFEKGCLKRNPNSGGT